MLPIFYINLASRPDRRDFMEAQLSSLGLAGQRIEAATPQDVTPQDAELYCNSERPAFLRRKEFARTLSHERAWQAMFDGGYEAALILEDDAELSPLLPAFLKECDSVQADLIRIETTGAAMRVYPIVSTGPSGVSVREFRSTPMGSAGYIIKAAAARRLIGSSDLRRRHFDLALYNPFEQPGASLTRLMTDPALCRQLIAADGKGSIPARSDIANERVQHIYAERHPIGFFWFKLLTHLRHGWRNMTDHIAQQSMGLERRVIPFQGISAAERARPSNR